MYIPYQSDALILYVTTVTAAYQSCGKKAAMPKGSLEKR